ncbi:MAG: hypothetical protein LBJ00_16195 [Planctomycetaceae bacterium]|jgi:flagellar motor switch protein FliG|nr:hypothetical protein [Planctomycetaceae bacterium]
MNGIKKSAKFLSGLDWNTISQLLDRLDSDTAKLLRREIMSMGNVSLAESDQLANEFLKAAGGKPRRNKNKFVTETFEISSGVYELPTDSRVANNFTNSMNNDHHATRLPQFETNPNYKQHAQLAEQPNHKSTYPPQNKTTHPQHLHNSQNQNTQNQNIDSKRLFEFLFIEPPATIAEAVCREHPQTIAVVIAGLPELLAEETLSVFPPLLQKEVGRRLAEIKLSDFDFADNPVLFEIASELKQRFNKRRGISFIDLDRFEDDVLIDLFRSVEMRTAMCALVGAKPRFIERITNQFTPTEEFIMRKLLKESGTIDEKEVESARSILIDQATEFLLR